MGAFSPSSKVTTQYKAAYIEKNVGTRSTRVLTHMVIKEVKSEVGRTKPFFHFTCPSEFLSLSRRRSSSRNVLSDEERGETDVFAGYRMSDIA